MFWNAPIGARSRQMGSKPARAELIDRPYPPESSTSLSFDRGASLSFFMRPPRRPSPRRAHRRAHGPGGAARLVCIGRGRYGNEQQFVVLVRPSGMWVSKRMTNRRTAIAAVKGRVRGVIVVASAALSIG